MATTNKELRYAQSLHEVYRVCGVENGNSSEAASIRELVANFCEQELPPALSLTSTDKSVSRRLRCFGDSSYQAFLEKSLASRQLRAQLAPCLNYAESNHSYDPKQIFFFLIHKINCSDFCSRRYAEGRDFALEAKSLSDTDGPMIELPPIIEPSKLGGGRRTQKLAASFVKMSLEPKAPVLNKHIEYNNHHEKSTENFAWEDFAFQIDVKAVTDSLVGSVYVPFDQTVSTEKSGPYSIEDFDVELLKQKLFEHPVLANIDLANKYFWEEGLRQSFRLCQNDMMFLLKAFIASKDLHTPQLCSNVRLLDRPDNKKRRRPSSEGENQNTQTRAQKRRFTERRRAQQLITTRR